VNTTSELRAAKSRPWGEEPALRMGGQTVVGLGVVLHPQQSPEAAVDVVAARLGPQPADDLPPLLCHRVAIVVVLGKVDAHRVVLRLVPAGDDIQARPSPPDLVDGRHRLGRHDGMVESGVDSGEHDQAVRVRQ